MQHPYYITFVDKVYTAHYHRQMDYSPDNRMFRLCSQQSRTTAAVVVIICTFLTLELVRRQNCYATQRKYLLQDLNREQRSVSTGPWFRRVDMTIGDLENKNNSSNSSSSSSNNNTIVNQEFDGARVGERNARLLKHLDKACISLNLSQPITEFTLKHMHFDHERKLLYCFVPKVACTSWKRIWMKMTGVVSKDTPLSSIDRLDVHTKLPKLNEEIENLKEILKTYRKFMFVRNPFDRILSAYKDKLLKEDKNSNYDFHQFIGSQIQKKQRGKSSGGHDVTFPEFISFISEDSDITTREQRNEHWLSVHDICNPCGIQYDFIGKYENLVEDATYVLDWMGVTDIIPKFPVSDQPTHVKHYDPKFYNQLNRKGRKQFFEKYLIDYVAFDYDFI